MKRITYILLLIIYLIPTIGISLSYHFCGDFVHSVNLDFSTNNKEPNDCCGENEKNNDGCCHNELKIFKISDKYAPKLKISFSPYYFVEFLYSVRDQQHLINSNISITKSIQEFPPGKKISIKNHLLLI